MTNQEAAHKLAKLEPNRLASRLILSPALAAKFPHLASSEFILTHLCQLLLSCRMGCRLCMLSILFSWGYGLFGVTNHAGEPEENMSESLMRLADVNIIYGQ